MKGRIQALRDRPRRRREAGLTLVELMVALALGSFLMLGAITVFMNSRQTFQVSESVARLQENARFALTRIEPDIRMASYWGLTTRPARIQGKASALDTVVYTGFTTDCNDNWSIDLGHPVDGVNNDYTWACAASGTEQAGADTLVVRRVAENPLAAASLLANKFYVQSARFQDGEIFVGTSVPAGFLPATSETHLLIVNGYYVSENSSLDAGGTDVPSLRVKRLVGMNDIDDEEVMPLIEDFQVQFGVDTDPLDTANRGAVDRYVNPGDGILDPSDASYIPTAEVVSVRVWLRVRAEHEEPGFQDTTNYVYADQDVGPFNDRFRRIVVSKTIYLRNAKPPA
jgi:type IV pilus assembly protein PilW